MATIELWDLDIGPWSEWAAALASVGSVWVASYFAKRSALAGAQLQINEARASEERERSEYRRRVAAAILGELEGIEARVRQLQMIQNYVSLSSVLLDTSKPLPAEYYLHGGSQHYTAIYDSLADRLGYFPADLAQGIAGIYIAIKGTLDTMNNFSKSILDVNSRNRMGRQAAMIVLMIEDVLSRAAPIKETLRSIG